MTSKFGYSARYENLAKELIRNMLGFKDDDANFAASMDYVMSNLLYHHYLDVNDHQIRRSLEGISFKISVHGHQKKGEQLQALIDKFLSLPVLQDKGDVKWSILSLLNELSQHPARDSLTTSFAEEIQNSLETSVKQDPSEADWMCELLDRSCHLQDKDETLSEWSDDDEMKLSFSMGAKSNHSQNQFVSSWAPPDHPQHEILAKGGGTLPSALIEEREKKNSLIREAHLAKIWLANNIQRPYWNDDERIGAGSSTNGSEVVQLTEYVIMRECTWLLLEPSSGYIFQQKDENFIIRPVCMLSLGKTSLQSLLHSFSSAASKRLSIKKWLEDVQSLLFLRSAGNAERFGSFGSIHHLGTFQAYADGLRSWLFHFDTEVNCLDKKIFAQEGCQTLLWLLHALEPLFSNLSVIYSIHIKAFATTEEPILHKSLKLLSLLIQGIESGMKKEDTKCMLILLQNALKSYLKTIYTLLWGIGAPRTDLLEEFGIIRNQDNTESLSGSIFHLKTIHQLNLPGLNFLRALRWPLLEVCNLREVVQDMLFEENLDRFYLEKLVEKEINSKYFPTIKSTIVKSTAFEIENTIVRSTTFEKENTNNNLYESKTVLSEDKIQNWFNESFESKGGELNESPNEDKLKFKLFKNDNSVLENTSKESITTQNTVDNLDSNSTVSELKNNCASNQIFTEDILLEKAFADVDLKPKKEEKENQFQKEGFQRSIGLEHLLTNVLVPVVQNRYSEMGKFLLKTLIEKNNLRQQLKIFIGIILLDSNLYMNEFYSYVFNKINCRETLEEWDLTQNLRFCIELVNKELAPYFSISLKSESNPRSGSESESRSESESKSNSSTVSTEDILSSICVEFTDLWPLCIIVKENHLIAYNNIFKFSLMLRRASYTVERLQLKEIAGFDACYVGETSVNSSNNSDDLWNHTSPSDKGEGVGNDIMPLAQRIHRLQLLRHWILYFARILRDHFCTAILDPFSKKMNELLQKKHFSHFKLEHEYLLNEVCCDCLLNGDSLSPVQITLTELFSTMEKIGELWQGSNTLITDSELSSLEEQYTSCHRLMASFLTTLASVRYCPLVEGLAQCLNYNCPT